MSSLDEMESFEVWSEKMKSLRGTFHWSNQSQPAINQSKTTTYQTQNKKKLRQLFRQNKL